MWLIRQFRLIVFGVKVFWKHHLICFYIVGWLGNHFIMPLNLFVHVECWLGLVNTKKLRKGFWIVWHATIWMLWKARNDLIFKGISKHEDEVVDDIKVLSWQWFLNRTESPSCLYYEWCWDPAECLRR